MTSTGRLFSITPRSLRSFFSMSSQQGRSSFQCESLGLFTASFRCLCCSRDALPLSNVTASPHNRVFCPFSNRFFFCHPNRASPVGNLPLRSSPAEGLTSQCSFTVPEFSSFFDCIQYNRTVLRPLRFFRGVFLLLVLFPRSFTVTKEEFFTFFSPPSLIAWQGRQFSPPPNPSGLSGVVRTTLLFFKSNPSSPFSLPLSRYPQTLVFF